MGALVIPVVLVIAALVAGALALSRFARRRRVRADALRRSDQTLHYSVPNGMDPAHVVLRLSRAGYEAVPDTTVGGPAALLIGGRGDRRIDREEVRRILTDFTDLVAAPVSAVRFTDE